LDDGQRVSRARQGRRQTEELDRQNQKWHPRVQIEWSRTNRGQRPEIG
jgi:hypothetical protein